MALRRQNEAMAGLLKQTLARDVASKGACLDPEILAAYFEHSLAVDESKACDLHLSQCAACRAQLAAMTRAEESHKAEGRESKVRHAWLTDWRWLTASAAAIAAASTILVVYGVHRPEQFVRTNETSNSPLVAMSKAQPADSTTGEISGSRIRKVEPNFPENGPRKPSTSDSELFAKRAVPSAPSPTGDTLARPPSESAKELKQAQPPDSSIAANQVSSAAPGERDLRQAAPQTRQGSVAGRALVMPQGQQQQSQSQQNQATQSVMVIEGKPQRAETPSSAPIASGSRAGGGVSPGAAVGGAAQSPPALQAEVANKKDAGSLPVTKARLAAANAEKLQEVEQRASQEVINTPIPNVKWRFDTAGYVERSTDGGATWNGQQVDPAGGVLAGSAPNAKVCWVVGRKAVVYVTKDAMNWTKVNPPDESVDLVEVTAKNASSAMVKTADGRHFSTHDRGKKWKLEVAEDSHPH